MELGVAAHTLSALLFLALAVLPALSRRHTIEDIVLIAASVATAAWAGATAIAFANHAMPTVLTQVLDVARSGGWMLLATTMLSGLSPIRKTALAYLIMASCLAVVVAYLLTGTVIDLDERRSIQAAVFLGRLAIALGGLVLVENVFRNTLAAERWRIKFLCLGIGGLFAYDFFLYSDSLLFRRVNLDLISARGVTTSLVMPFFVLWLRRSRVAGQQITVSRKFVSYTATMIGAGIYLLLMAGAGSYVRQVGGKWGPSLQVAFLFGTIILLFIPLFSGSFRAYLHVLIEKTFFKYRYDYREEWLRFIRTISAGAPAQSLPVRVVQATGDLIDSPEGGVWFSRDPELYALMGVWNLSRWRLNEAEAAVAIADPLVAYLERTQRIIDLDELRESPELYEGLEIPEWLRRIERAWLIVPLMHLDRLNGFIVLGRARAPRTLKWEDYDIMRTVGRQAASYLALHEAALALAESRQFDAFNRRFAFVVHDIKNLASQLSLIVSNAAKHQHNPAFQHDMIETARRSVEKLNRLLQQIHEHQGIKTLVAPVALSPLLRRIVEARKFSGSRIDLQLYDESLAVAADEDRLGRVVENFVQNAVEALNGKGQIEVRLFQTTDTAVVEVQDDGPGMDPEFVRDGLFQPFRTTKKSGYGIGMYEARDFVRSLGGRLDVSSELGRGTLVRMILPAVNGKRR
jgi:putative PEP-CTERM system histidine kinase